MVFITSDAKFTLTVNSRKISGYKKFAFHVSVKFASSAFQLFLTAIFRRQKRRVYVYNIKVDTHTHNGAKEKPEQINANRAFCAAISTSERKRKQCFCSYGLRLADSNAKWRRDSLTIVSCSCTRAIGIQRPRKFANFRSSLTNAVSVSKERREVKFGGVKLCLPVFLCLPKPVFLSLSQVLAYLPYSAVASFETGTCTRLLRCLHHFASLRPSHCKVLPDKSAETRKNFPALTRKNEVRNAYWINRFSAVFRGNFR